MILRVIKDFFFNLYNLWTRFEGVDNLTAFDSVMLKSCSFSHDGAYLSLNCCKTKKTKTKKKKQNKITKKRMSGIVRTFISAFYFLLRHFQLYLPSIASPSMIILFSFFRSPHICFVCFFVLKKLISIWFIDAAL